MKLANTKLKRTLLTIGGTIILVCTLVILFVSPITKYLIEKYSVKYTGRQIKMDWAYVNPFTGFFHFNNFRIYEEKGDTLFLSMKGLSIGVNLRKILSKEYEITSITLDKPRGIAIQKTRNAFNFSDIIQHFSSPETDTTKPKQPLHLNILNIKIKAGTFYLYDTLVHVNYFIKDFYFESTGERWNADTFPGTFSFSPGIGPGHVAGNFTINTHNSDYRFAFVMQKLNLAIIEQYLKDMTNYGTFSAYLDASINVKGNFKDGQNIDAKGRISINDFHFGKTRKDDYFAFDTLVLAIDEINPKKHFYHLDAITLTHPYFEYEKYDYLDNIETMFGENGANVNNESTDPTKFNLILSLAHFFTTISKDFFESIYRINKLAIKRADIKYNDYSTSEKFSIDANPLDVRADSIDKSHGNMQISLTSGVHPYGSFFVNASINPRDSATFNLNYHFTQIPVTLFNPYLISYTSFPLDRGTIELNGVWNVQNGFIQSENHLLVIDPRVTKRLKNKADKWIPLWLVMAFVREKGDVIDYQIPITGNLNKPKFHLHDIVINTLNNVFVKPPTTPYRMEVKKLEYTIEKSLALKWEMHQATMTTLQKMFVEKMAGYVASTPTASIVISPQLYTAKEKEYILFFEAKKKYYLSRYPEKAQSFNKGDSEYVEKMSIKDSSFVHYLNKHLTRSLLFTIQDKCSNLIDTNIVNRQLELLNKLRKNTFVSYFKEKGVAGRISFLAPHSTIPYNGFSFYKIEYKGEFPAYLINAYKKIDELNSESPREKYKKERGGVKSI